MDVGTSKDSTGKTCIQRASARKVLVFQLAGQAYGLPLEAVREILPLSLLSQPPCLPPVLAGFLNLGGVAMPVLRLARLFRLAEESPRFYTPLLILRCEDLPLAVLVDAVQDVVCLDESQVTPFHENDCAEGLATVGTTNLVLLSDQRLLREQEQRRFRELAALEQSRLDDLQEVAS